METNNNVDLCISSVGRKRRNTKLNNSNGGYQHNNYIEKKTIHPSLILLHWMKATQAWHSGTKAKSSLLYTPYHIKTKVCVDSCGDKACISVVKAYQKFV